MLAGDGLAASGQCDDSIPDIRRQAVPSRDKVSQAGMSVVTIIESDLSKLSTSPAFIVAPRPEPRFTRP
jgi:hypothetical protein